MEGIYKTRTSDSNLIGADNQLDRRETCLISASVRSLLTSLSADTHLPVLHSHRIPWGSSSASLTPCWAISLHWDFKKAILFNLSPNYVAR